MYWQIDLLTTSCPPEASGRIWRAFANKGVIQKQFDWSRISKMATSSGHTDYLHTPLPAGVLKCARECEVGDDAYKFGSSA